MTENTASLLVPIAAEALVVNHVVQTNVTFHRWEMDYNKLLSFESPAPSPTAEAPGLPDPGVHLHWALPRALTRGAAPQATATAQVVAGKISTITVVNGGFGYDLLPPVVVLSGGSGSGAIAQANVSNGVVTSITLIDGGNGYTMPPQVTIAPSSAVNFPFVPNRWLVVRYSPAPSLTQPRPTKAWLLQSDTIDPNADTLESNSFVDPDPTTPGSIAPTRIGAAPIVLESWEGESGSPKKLFLRAVGPGDATFAAFQPGVVNVFSFYDPIAAPGAIWTNPNAQKNAAVFPENTELTYLLVGWYSDGTQDPLYGSITGWDAQGDPLRSPWSQANEPSAAWTDLIKALNWSVETQGVEVADLPSQSLYHAMVYGVNWQTSEVPPRPSSTTDKITVAVGNSSIEALAAIVAKYDDVIDAEHLAAFQYDNLQILDQPDGEAQLDLKIRKSGFSAVPGGTLWQIVPVGPGATDSGGLDPGTLPPPTPLTADQSARLVALNTAQRQQDADVRLLTSLQWELHATSWKQRRLAGMSAPDQQQVAQYLQSVPTTLTSLQALDNLLSENLDPHSASGILPQVVTQQSKVQKQAAALPDPTNASSILDYATNILGLDPTKFRLKAAAMPPFYQVSDPVVLVAGIETSAKQGKLTEKDPLPCRLVTQTATGVNVASGNTSIPITAETPGMENVISLTPDNPHLPAAVKAGVAALNLESFFTDTTQAATIVKVGLNSSDQPTINALAKGMGSGTAQISAITAPLAADFAFSGWTQQPWSPLYMQWAVTFYPTVQSQPMTNESDWPFAQVTSSIPASTPADNWVFDGTDFNWYGTLAATGQDYIGRTFLTPQSTHVLISRLQNYLKGHPDPDLKAVENLIDTIGEWNFLSQRLSGLVDQLIMRSLQPSPAPDTSVAQQIGEQYHAVPDPSKGEQDLSFGGGNPFFFPVRGGFLKFKTLTVVDAFGQVIDLMEAAGNTGTGVPFAPVRGPDMAPMAQTNLPQPSELIKLAPRLTQTGRLNFRFICADDDSQDTELYPESSPVCGWVLPNHLDGGLMIYDTSGEPLGELMMDGGSGNVRWLPAPDSPSAIVDPETITNIHFRKFVLALTASKDQGAGFSDLLQTIDETLWTVEPMGARADENLSVLIGRPLALVRAMLQFELNGVPVYNQSWGETLQSASADVARIMFPIRLGSLDLYDDGLMGYFKDDDYTQFNSVHQPDNFKPSAVSYLQPIGVDGNYLQLSFNYPDYSRQYATLLLDPRGALHAFTGILPTSVVSLPPAYYENALARMAVTFRVGPVLSDARSVTLPRPTERNGTWSWIKRVKPLPAQWNNKDWNDPAGWETDPVIKTDQQTRFEDIPPRLLEGWFKLTPNDIEK